MFSNPNELIMKRLCCLSRRITSIFSLISNCARPDDFYHLKWFSFLSKVVNFPCSTEKAKKVNGKVQGMQNGFLRRLDGTIIIIALSLTSDKRNFSPPQIFKGKTFLAFVHYPKMGGKVWGNVKWKVNKS